jgi:glycosyltransferase involved in cell wall biosynthesis
VNLERLGVAEDRIRIIPTSMPPGMEALRVSEDRSRSSRDTVRIVWVGRIDRAKGLIVLLQAANLLKNDFRNFELLIGGKVWDAAYYRELLDYKAAANLEEAHFIGFVSDLQSFLLDADIFALPSLMEVGPATVLEAMGCGLPVVGSDVGAVPDDIVDNETGFLVPPGNPVALATKLRLLVSDEKLRIRMGRKARERAMSQFSYNRMFSMVLDMYRELV